MTKLTIEEMQKIAEEKGGRCLSKKYVNNRTKLEWQCKKGHLWEATADNIKSGNWCPHCAGNAKSSIEEMRNIAKARGGLCLSTNYINTHTKLKWQCKEGHSWEATPNPIKRGHWCPECYGNVKLNIEEMQKIAKEREGECLSNQYINATAKLKWQCKEGHIWEASSASIKFRGSWCPFCAGNAKHNIEKMKILASSRSGKCLSDEYINSKTKLEWQCEKGHIWDATPDKIMMGGWCPICRGSANKTLEEMQQIAFDGGGKCLSDEYINSKTKLEWQCGKGHMWKATPHDIIRGSWCPICSIKIRANKQKSTIEQMREIAKNRGGLCLSQEYLNTHTKLEWQCAKGHTWWSNPSNIIQNQWCPVCGGSLKKTLEEMQKIAEEKGGKCLSEKYINSKTKLKWQCKEGHIWETKPDKILMGRWCPNCAGVIKLTIEEMQNIAKERGGLCLSTHYKTARKKLKWQCKEGHIWEAVPDAIKRGSWCPKCSENISERICRKIFENIFNEQFPKRKPDWLLTSQGKRMELDGYCKKLGIAFEYQGIQHYKYVPMFHETRTLERQKTWDEFKRKTCSENNVILIEIPYTIDYEKMPEYILQECKKRNIEVPEITKSLDYKLMNIYSPEKLKEMQQIAKTNGGVCLSDRYVDAQTKLQWQCEKGHIWEAKPRDITRDHWCPTCGIQKNVEKQRLNIEDIQELAKKKGGVCLSQEYINNRTNIKWKCKDGHIWNASVSNIKAGKWCPICGHKSMGDKKRLTIENMKEYAKKKDGICLSNKYVDAHTKLRWQCKEGHVWEATPNSIQRESWCPNCGVIKNADKRRLGIEEMQELAKSKGGKCLSEKYIDSNSKLMWQCEKEHIWEATPGNIKAGHWCAQCYGNVKFSIEDMQKIAKERGGVCLSDQYLSTHTKLKWQCKEGHIWETSPSHIKSGQWCPICAISRKGLRIYTIEMMGEIAEKRKGKCLSDNYTNYQTKLKWQCEKGHIWHATPGKIIMGQWCPTCAVINRANAWRYSIEEMQELARQRGGRCLSAKYIDSQTKLRWQCKEKHEWEATPASVARGSWCARCAGIYKLTLSDMQELAKKNGGICLSKEYVNTSSKLRWQCNEGHIWEATPDGIKTGHWCPKCSTLRRANSQRSTIERMREVAEKRMGKCLSEVYVNNHTKLKWQCNEGHTWLARPTDVIRNKWCPICAKNHMRRPRKYNRNYKQFPHKQGF